MGLVQIKRQIQQSICQKELLNSDVDVVEQDDSGDDLDDNSIGNGDYELVLVEDQLCSIPYELYELPDLKDILSLDTWNSCLTDDERFYLSAFLPDMDQQTFWLTMKELLGGKDMFFGSPLTVLFERMIGGFYPPTVAHFREGLQFLQKRIYYLSLRSYHENMAQAFVDMKRAWVRCQPSTGVEERIRIWKNWKNKKPMNGVDLNALPEDENLLDQSNTKRIVDPVSNMVKFPPVVPLAPPKSNGKGVLKIKPKPTAAQPIQTGMVCRPTPKGVLKIVPRAPINQMHQPRVMQGRQDNPALVDGFGYQTLRLSLPQSTCRCNGETYSEKPQIPMSVRGGKAYRVLEPPNCTAGKQQMEHLNNDIAPSGIVRGRIKKIKRVGESSLDCIVGVQDSKKFSRNSLTVKKYSRRKSQTGKHLNVENLWSNMVEQDPEYDHDSSDHQVAPALDNQNSSYHRKSDTVMRVSEQMLATSWDRPKEVHLDANRVAQRPYDEQGISKGLQNGVTLPITYKRRKALSKVNKLDISNP